MIYNRIKELCTVKNISVSQLERSAGISNGSISKWTESSPTIDKLLPVARLLEVTIDYLVSEDVNAES